MKSKDMAQIKLAAIVLAAGKGTRLAGGRPSAKPKVLYEIGGKPIITYTIDLLKAIGLGEIVIVVGHKAEEVKRVLGGDYKYALQKQRLGTGHAALVGLGLVSERSNNILILNGDDSAFYKPESIRKAINKHVGVGNTLTFVTVEVKDPTGLGRIIRNKDGLVVDIVQEKVANKLQKKIKEINAGCYIVKRGWLQKSLKQLKKSPVGEYYLVDLIKKAVFEGRKVQAYKLNDPDEWFGVNTPEELKRADLLVKDRLDAEKKR